MHKAALGLCAAAALCLAAPAFADVTVTVTDSACKDPARPADVPAPASPSAAAGDAAMHNKDYALALVNFRPLAEKGDVEGQRDYGMMLMQDCTGLQDKAAGATWLGKAADGGDTIAQYRLGLAYLNGRGVTEDDAKAYDLFSKSAASGHSDAQEQLGYLYLSGRGVARDGFQGMAWSVKAAEQGNPFALVNIAQAYFRGEVLPQDNDKAAYYMFAGMQRSTGNQRQRFVNTTNNISRQLSPSDLQHAAEKARRWSPGSGSLSDVLDDAKQAARDRKS